MSEPRPLHRLFGLSWLDFCQGSALTVEQQLPQQGQTAMLHLFSAREELLRYGKDHYRPYSPDTSSLIYQLFQEYEGDPDMSSKLEEFVRQTKAEMLRKLSPEERLE